MAISTRSKSNARYVVECHLVAHPMRSDFRGLLYGEHDESGTFHFKPTNQQPQDRAFQFDEDGARRAAAHVQELASAEAGEEQDDYEYRFEPRLLPKHIEPKAEYFTFESLQEFAKRRDPS